MTGAGAGVLLLALCLLVSSPLWAARGYAWVARAPKPSTAQVEAVVTALSCASPAYVPIVPPDELRLLTADELCRRWRVSCEELDEESPLVVRADVVGERQRLLEEIERRNPGAFSAWLTSDAPTTVLPQLTGPGSGAGARAGAGARQPSIDWDALLHRKD